MIHLQRVYGSATASDGKRFLVERLWPRGVRKAALHMDGWLKDAAPSDALRRWFNHDPDKWTEFQRRYRAELERNPQACQPLLEAAQNGNVTLLFSARDLEHNNAVALRLYLQERLKGDPRRR